MPQHNDPMDTINRKIFATLFFSLFATVTGVGIVVPLLPVYAHRLGAGGFYIGLIFGAFALSRTLFLPYFGRLSDRKGRKPLIVIGLFAYAVISLAFIWSDTVESLITIRFIQGIASAMIMPVIQAYVGDITPEGSEGLSMGLFHMSVFLGLSLGPLMGGVIKDRFSLDAAFACLGGLAFVGCLLSIFLLPPRNAEPGVSGSKKPVAWMQILKDREIAGLFLFRMAYTACIGILWGFMPVFADSVYSLGSAAIGVLVMLGVFISGLIHAPMGWLADRVDRKKLVITGGVVTGCALVSFQWVRGFWDLFAANALFGLGGGIAMPALMALAVSKGNMIQAMGSVMSLLTMAHSLGMMSGALFAGVMMDNFQLRHAFVVGSLIMAAGAGLFYFLTKR